MQEADPDSILEYVTQKDALAKNQIWSVPSCVNAQIVKILKAVRWRVMRLHYTLMMVHLKMEMQEIAVMMNYSNKWKQLIN